MSACENEERSPIGILMYLVQVKQKARRTARYVPPWWTDKMKGGDPRCGRRGGKVQLAYETRVREEASLFGILICVGAHLRPLTG
jgi:hypothetical protein